MALVVFDLDGTLTRGDTLIGYLYGFLRAHPGRALRLWRTLPAVIGFALGLSNRGALKSALIKAVLGGCERAQIEAWTHRFVTHLLAGGFYADALAQLAEHRRRGDTLVLMSASPDLYVPEIGRRLAFAEVISTGVRWNAQRLGGELSTVNRRGAEKARCFRDLKARHPGLPTVAYGNSGSDLDHLRLADQGWMVNGGAALRRQAQRDRIGCLQWR